MVRTDGGSNYSIFKERNFVALNLSNYPMAMISEARRAFTNENQILTFLKERLKSLYQSGTIDLETESTDRSYASIVGRIAGQIYRFSFEMQEGDIVIIPSSNSDFISIGKIIDRGLSTDETINKNFSFARGVEWINEIPKRRLDPCLFNVIRTQQAVSNITEYQEFIERNYNSMFIVNDEYHYVLTINSETISARSLSGLVENILSLVNDISENYNLDIDIDEVQLSVNVNSPGKLDLKSNIKTCLLIMAAATALSGGTMKYDGLEFTTDGVFQSFVEAVNSYNRTNSEIEQLKERTEFYFNDLEVLSVEEWNERMSQEVDVERSEQQDDDSVIENGNNE